MIFFNEFDEVPSVYNHRGYWLIAWKGLYPKSSAPQQDLRSVVLKAVSIQIKFLWTVLSCSNDIKRDQGFGQICFLHFHNDAIRPK